MTFEVRNVPEADKRTYESKENGYSVIAHKKSCFFCSHLTDIWFDYTHGPYMFHCEQEIDPEEKEIVFGECQCFKEVEEDEVHS